MSNLMYLQEHLIKRQSTPPYPGAVFDETSHRWKVPKHELPPVWESGGGYVSDEHYKGYLTTAGVTTQTIKDIHDIFRMHQMGGAGQSKIDDKIAQYWNSPGSHEGHALRVLSKLEHHAAKLHHAYLLDTANNELAKLAAYAPQVVTTEQYDDAEFEIGISPKYTEDYSEQYEQKIGEKKRQIEALRNLKLYRKVSSKDDDKQVFSFTSDPQGANTSPLTNNTRISPDFSIPFNDLENLGYHILYGYARQWGASGESEVLLIRDNQKLSKSKVYLTDNQEAPKGTQVHQGPQGGRFYESSGVTESHKNTPPSKPIFFHGSDAKIDTLRTNNSETGEALFLTSDAFTAEEYGKYVYEIDVRKLNVKTIDAEDKPWYEIPQKRLIEEAKSEGYDAIEFRNIKDNKHMKNISSDVLAVINVDKLKIHDVNDTSEEDWYLRPSKDLTPNDTDSLISSKRFFDESRNTDVVPTRIVPFKDAPMKVISINKNDEQLRAFKRKTRINISDIIPSQVTTPADGVLAYMKNPPKGLPEIAITDDGEYHVFSGHTRLIAGYLNGDTSPEVEVFHVTEEGKVKKSITSGNFVLDLQKYIKTLPDGRVVRNLKPGESPGDRQVITGKRGGKYIVISGPKEPTKEPKEQEEQSGLVDKYILEHPVFQNGIRMMKGIFDESILAVDTRNARVTKESAKSSRLNQELGDIASNFNEMSKLAEKSIELLSQKHGAEKVAWFKVNVPGGWKAGSKNTQMNMLIAVNHIVHGVPIEEAARDYLQTFKKEYYIDEDDSGKESINTKRLHADALAIAEPLEKNIDCVRDCLALHHEIIKRVFGDRKTVKLYRGANGKTIASTPSKEYSKGKIVNLSEKSVMSRWSLLKEIAYDFARDRHDESYDAAVLEIEVPVEELMYVDGCAVQTVYSRELECCFNTNNKQAVIIDTYTEADDDEDDE